jgi:hypothetical protein
MFNLKFKLTARVAAASRLPSLTEAQAATDSARRRAAARPAPGRRWTESDSGGLGLSVSPGRPGQR